MVRPFSPSTWKTEATLVYKEKPKCFCLMGEKEYRKLKQCQLLRHEGDQNPQPPDSKARRPVPQVRKVLGDRVRAKDFQVRIQNSQASLFSLENHSNPEPSAMEPRWRRRHTNEQSMAVSVGITYFMLRPRLNRHLVDELIDDVPEPLVGEFEGSRSISICRDNKKIRPQTEVCLSERGQSTFHNLPSKHCTPQDLLLPNTGIWLRSRVP